MHFGISEGKGGLKYGSRPSLCTDIFWNCPLPFRLNGLSFRLNGLWCFKNVLPIQSNGSKNGLNGSKNRLNAFENHFNGYYTDRKRFQAVKRISVSVRFPKSGHILYRHCLSNIPFRLVMFTTGF